MTFSLLNISDLHLENLFSLINGKIKHKSIEGKNIGLLFEKYSTRTRLSFSVGISQLKGNAVDIRFEEMNISRDETFEDTFKVMNCYLDGLIYRTTKHERLISASKYFNKPIINALSDQSHPCQILSDLYTLNEHFGSLKLNILWMGDMNNVCFSLVEAANIIQDLNLFICSPKNISETIDWPKKSNVKIHNKLDEIDLNKINCVMTDVFISMNDAENDKKVSSLMEYSVNSELMSKTNKNCIFMHCLPAKVGFEVSKEVFNSSKSIVWKQAYNRLVSQKVLLQSIDWNIN